MVGEAASTQEPVDVTGLSNMGGGYPIRDQTKSLSGSASSSLDGYAIVERCSFDVIVRPNGGIFNGSGGTITFKGMVNRGDQRIK